MATEEELGKYKYLRKSYSQASNNTTQQNNSSSALNHAEILSNQQFSNKVKPPRRGNRKALIDKAIEFFRRMH